MGKVLSVVVPSYNVEEYLDKCLSSFCDGRLVDGLEVLVINDGSTDSTAAIAQKYVDKSPAIFRLINKENGGHGSAVNRGIEEASGKYFRVVDGDDWVITDNLCRLLEVLKSVDADLVVDERREVHMVTGATKFSPLPQGIPLDREIFFEDFCETEDLPDCLMMHTMSLKTALLRTSHVRLREHIFYVDYEYIVKSTCAVKTVWFTDLEIYQYLVGNANQSVATANYVKRFDHHDQVVKELLAFSERAEVSEKVRRYMERRIQLVIHSHYKIALIYDDDRRRGARRASAFQKYLKENYPKYEKLTHKRYVEASVLHRLGVDAAKLDKLKRQ